MNNDFNLLSNQNFKLYTLCKSPTPEEPYLTITRHRNIIEHFDRGEYSCHMLNSEGSVDLYYFISLEEELDDYLEEKEIFNLTFHKNKSIDLELSYGEGNCPTFTFKLDEPTDYYSLLYMIEKKKLNIFYIIYLEDVYVCSGLKAINLPVTLSYDILRYLEGKEPLLLPKFSSKVLSDKILSEEIILGKAWGFYLNYEQLIKRVGKVEDAEEIVSRYILHALTKLQRSRRKNITEDLIFLWVSRKIGLDEQNKPVEYYVAFLNGGMLTGQKDKDFARKIFEKTMSELPELAKIVWTSPLAEEAVPLAATHKNSAYRIDVTEDFYNLSSTLFLKYYQPHKEYVNYYAQIVNLQKKNHMDTKVYSLFEKRKKLESKEKISLSAAEIRELIQEDKYEFPSIFKALEHLKPEEQEDIIISLCEKYNSKIEPYLLSCLSSKYYSLQDAAIIGLGVLESVKAIPLLIEKLKGTKKEADLVKYSLALIGDRACPYLVPLLQASKAELRIRAIESLALIGTTQAINIIKNHRKDRSTRVEDARKRALSQPKYNN